MSTPTLIIIATLTCTICLISLWLAQLKRQKAIERARKTIIYTAQINQLQQIAESTAQYLDDSLIQFLAGRINYTAELLIQNKITPDKRCQHSIELAQGWASNPKSLRKQAHKEKNESQQKCLTLLKSIIQHLRQSVMDHQTSRTEAKQLAYATKLSKIKLTCQHFQQNADEALEAEQLTLGITQLKKLSALLSKTSPLPADLEQQLIDCQSLIVSTQKIINADKDDTSSKRLEEEFNKQEEQDQDWQKKQLYDQ